MASTSKRFKAKISKVKFEKWEDILEEIDKLLVNEKCEDEFYEIRSKYTDICKSLNPDQKSNENIKKIRETLFVFLNKWFGSEGKGGSISDFQVSNRVIQIIKTLYYCDPIEIMSNLNKAFITKPIRENDIKIFNIDKLSVKDKDLVKDAKDVIKRLVYPFLSRLCLDIDSPGDFRGAPVERTLHAFYLFWHTIKKVYPETNFLDGLYTCELFVKLLRYDKANNNSRSYDCSHQQFYKAHFSGLIFKDDIFERCSFYAVDFSRSYLERINFKGAAFRSEEMYDNDELPLVEEAQTGIFKHAILRESDFSGALAPNLDFSEATISKCILSNLPVWGNTEGAGFSNMICHSSQWDQCDFSGADFSGSSFYGSNIKKLIINSETNFYDVDFKFCHLEFLSENEEELKMYKLTLAKCESLFNSDINPLLKELLLFELDEASARSINKALFYSPEKLDYWKNAVDPNSDKKISLDLPVDRDLYRFKRELEEDLTGALKRVKKKLTFNTITEIKNCIEDIEKNLKNFKEQRVDEYYFKMLKLSEEISKEKELENAFFNLSKIQLPRKFQKRFSSLKKRYDARKGNQNEGESMRIVKDLRDFVKELLKDELE